MPEVAAKISAPSSRVWILLGIPVLFFAGTLMHFIYEWSGDSTLVGIFAPVNESAWEHLKLTYWPMLLWWVIGYIVYRKSGISNAALWFFSCSAAQYLCPIVVLAFFYTYTGAFGIESLFLDIFSLLLALAAAQFFALHLYKHLKAGPGLLAAAIIMLAILAASFTVFTFDPAHIPVFRDALTGSYGIQ